MSTISKTLALGLFLLVNACGASTVTASSRIERGAPAGGDFGRIVEANSPRNVEQPVFERQVDHEDSTPRESPSFRYESDCWRCR